MDTLTRMRAFIDVVEAEGFSAAARKIGRSKALLSKYVRELEDELGALLLNRTTRQFSLTEAGHTYFARASEIIREIDSLADSVRESARDVRGRIKLSAPRTFADVEIGQSLIDFAKAYPDITLDIHLDDRFVDLVEEGFDLAIRITRLENSSLIARKLAPFSVRLCASPELIAKRGRPLKPQDMAHLPCIVDTNGRWLSNWPFIGENGGTLSVPVSGPIEVNSPLTAKTAALAGLGYAMLPDFIAAEEIESGRLVTVLDEHICTEGSGIFAVYPHRRYLPAKVRVLVDYLAQWFKRCDPERRAAPARVIKTDASVP
ncbi:MAG TPA: LysR family transcriptional regulator [Rhizobiaceae bacterium]|nr:LysR family transcriptional regulator [Rhizobiaceae bacterium]